MKIGATLDVSVVIVNFHQAKLTIRCIELLLKSKGVTFELIIIDNSCVENEQSKLKSIDNKKINLIFSSKNIGCCEAYNIGIGCAKGKYIFILNNDTEIKDNNALKKMVRFMDKHRLVGVIQPKIKSLRRPEYFEYSGAAGGYVDVLGYPFCRGRVFQSIERDNGQYDNVVPVSWASTCAFFARRKAIIEAGLFDPIYFAYAEEIDICLKLWKLGYRVLFYPRAEVYHLGEASWRSRRGHKTYLIHRNHLILYFKCYPLEVIFRSVVQRIILELLSTVYYLSKNSNLHIFFVGLANLSCVFSFAIIMNKRRSFNKQMREHKFPIYQKSIVFDYFLHHKKYFTDLDQHLLKYT